MPDKCLFNIRWLPFPKLYNPIFGRFAVVFLAKQGNGFRLFLFLIDQKHYRYEKKNFKPVQAMYLRFVLVVRT